MAPKVKVLRNSESTTSTVTALCIGLKPQESLHTASNAQRNLNAFEIAARLNKCVRYLKQGRRDDFERTRDDCVRGIENFKKMSPA